MNTYTNSFIFFRILTIELAVNHLKAIGMKAIYKFLSAIGFLFFFCFQTADAQIFQTRSEIIETHGTPFYAGVTDKGENYLFYKIPITTESSDTYHQRRILYFKKSQDGTETCYKWKILEPSTETKLNATSFKENLVQVDQNTWKDYGKGIVYEMEVNNRVCSITAWYDNEVAIAKIYKV